MSQLITLHDLKPKCVKYNMQVCVVKKHEIPNKGNGYLFCMIYG